MATPTAAQPSGPTPVQAPAKPRLPALADRMRARYPLLGLVSADEREAVREVQLCGAAAQIGVEVAWAGRQDPATVACDAVARLADGQSRALVLPGAQQLLASAALVRVLAENLTGIERAGQCVVLVGAHLPEVPELSRDLATLQLPLPQRGELEPLAAAALRDANGQLDSETFEGAVQSLQGLTLAQARRALRRVRGRKPADQLAELRAEKRDLLASTGVVEVVTQVPHPNEIGGLDELKTWLGRQKLALTRQARTYGLPVPRGVLLVGVQGCGKTLTAKTASAVLGLPLLRLDLGRLYTAAAVPDENLRLALQVAEAMAPVVLWIDEIDKAFASATSGASEAGARVFGSLLTWLGEQRRGVFVAATANRLTHLPAELMRKGRFDETFFVDVPDHAARAEIFAVAIARSGRDPRGWEMERLAKASDRLTGAEIEQAFAEAMQVAFCAGREPTVHDVEAVLAKIVPFVETYDAQVRELRQWAKRHCRNGAKDRSLHELFQAARDGQVAPKPAR